MKLYLKSVGFLVGLICLAWQPLAQAAPPYPFYKGEILRYGIRWEQVNAGSCWLEVRPFTFHNGQPAWHFQLRAESKSVVDKLFKVRELVESYVARDFSGSLFYSQHATGKKKKDIVVKFYRSRGQVQYSNFGGKRDPVAVPPNTFDPLSSFYRMRTLDLKVGEGLEFPVSDGKKAFFQRGDVIARERISVPWGTMDALVLVPYTTHFSGIFKKSEDPTVRVWISDDARRLPLRIQIKVVIGSIYFDLEHCELPDLPQ